MRHKLSCLLALITTALLSGCKVVQAQNPPPTAGFVVYQSAVPVGTCTLPNYLTVVTTSAKPALYQCVGNPLTWQQVGINAGVKSIDNLEGAFVFLGPGVTHSGNTYTFTGNGTGIGSIAWVLPSWLTANPVTLGGPGGTQTFLPTSGQTPHQVIGTCGTATAFAPCSLVPADIPALPYLSSTSTQLPITINAVAHNFLTSYDSVSGVFTAAQPSYSDLSGSLSFADLTGSLGTTQGPNLTGIVKDAGGTLSVALPGTDYLAPNGSSAALSVATNGAFGVVKPDGTSIIILGGVISAVGGGGGGNPPGGTNGQVQWNNLGTFAGLTVSGDCSLVASTGVFTCNKTGGVSFAASATTDTTAAGNISSGTLPAGRLPNPSVSTLGGVEAILPLTNNFVDSISTAGVPHLSQPVFSNISGNLGTAQGPALTGLLKDSGGTLSAAIAGTDYVTPTGSAAGLSPATLIAFGVVKPDGTSITISGGVLSASGTANPPGGTSGQVQYNNAGSFGGFTLSGDATLTPSTGIIFVTKTNGVSFAPSATTDTTNASNISSGTLAAGRLPNPSATSLGGIQSIAAVTNNFVDSISVLGVPHSAQPGFQNISGNLGSAQAPNLTGLLKDTAGTFAVAVAGTDYLTPTGSSAALSQATTGAFGVVKPDGTSITIAGGVITAVVGNPGGTTGQLQYNNAGVFAGYTLSGDATLVPSTGVITVAKTGGVAFAASATTNTTNAANISSGTLPAARLPNPSATTLGGVQSAAAVSNQFIDSISTLGVPHLSQPAFSNLSGALGTTQGPVLTGLLKDTAGTLSAATAGTDYLLPTGSSAALSKATTIAFGVVEPDGTTIGVASGVISVASVPFSSVAAGTGTAALLIGSGGSLGTTGGGSINATLLGGTPLSGICQVGGTGCPQLAVTKASVSHQFFTSYTSTTGLFTAAQPAFTDVSGTLGTAQGPSSLTGLLVDTAGTLSVATSANIIALWTGTCNNTTVLFGDGVCRAGGGGGGGNTTSTSLTTNSLSKANGLNSIIDSLFTDNGTTGAYTGTGGLAATKLTLTDTVNNGQDTYTAGSSGDSTCMLNAASNSFTNCIKGGIPQVSVGPSGAYVPYALTSAYATLTDGAPIVWAVAGVQLPNATVTLNHTLSTRVLNMTGLTNGASGVLVIKQDSTGGALMTLGTGCTWKIVGGGGGAIALTATANAIDILAWSYDGTNCYGVVNANFN